MAVRQAFKSEHLIRVNSPLWRLITVHWYTGGVSKAFDFEGEKVRADFSGADSGLMGRAFLQGEKFYPRQVLKRPLLARPLLRVDTDKIDKG